MIIPSGGANVGTEDTEGGTDIGGGSGGGQGGGTTVIGGPPTTNP